MHESVRCRPSRVPAVLGVVRVPPPQPQPLPAESQLKGRLPMQRCASALSIRCNKCTEVCCLFLRVMLYTEPC